MGEPVEQGRIDHWLKLTCLFKQRSDATAACRGGLVKLNGERCKPSSNIRPGDTVEIVGGHYRKVVVLAIPAHSISKQQAREEYYRDETPEMPRLPAPVIRRERGAGRPSKKERRDLEKLKKFPG